MTDTTTIDTFATLAHYLRQNGIPAIAGSTGGNCNAVTVYLTDYDEVLINDANGGPLSSVDEVVDEWAVALCMLDADVIDKGTFPIGDHAALLAFLLAEFDDMFDHSAIRPDIDAVPVPTRGSADQPYTIGDMSRDGLLQIVDTRWDGNGTLFVTVREMIGGGDAGWVGGMPIRRMRTLAKRALMHPDTIRSAKIVNRFTDVCGHVTFAVSRLES